MHFASAKVGRIPLTKRTKMGTLGLKRKAPKDAGPKNTYSYNAFGQCSLLL